MNFKISNYELSIIKTQKAEELAYNTVIQSVLKSEIPES